MHIFKRSIFLVSFSLLQSQIVLSMRDTDIEKEENLSISHFSKKKKNISIKDSIYQEKPTTLWEAAQYFILLEKKRREKKINSPSVDRWKLQKLCYYAQGYYLARFEGPLFEEDLTAYYYGPYNEDLNIQCNEYYGYSDLDLQKLKSFNPKLELAPRHSAHLDIIFDMNLHKSGSQLVSDTHKEEPWKEKCENDSLGEIIEKNTLKSFFKKIEFSYQYLAKEIQKSPVFDTVNYIKDFIKNKNSYQLINLQDIFNDLEEKHLSFFDENLNNKRDYVFWPHQDLKKRVLSNLFFPQELKDLCEPAIVLYGRNHILTQLAYVAKYGDPLALHHLAAAFNSFEQDFENENIDEEEEAEGEEKIENNKSSNGNGELIKFRKMRLELEERRDKILNEMNLNTTHTDISWFYLGQLYTFLFREKEAQECFKKACEKKDPRAMFEFASRQKEKEKGLKLFREAIELGELVAYLGLGRLSESNQEAYEYYMKAGESGVSEGYHRAALMIVNGYISDKKKEDAAELFERAGNLGRISSYENAGSLWKSLGDNKKAKQMYKKLGEQGDFMGYKLLGDVYFSKNKLQKQHDILNKMNGPFSFFYKNEKSVQSSTYQYFATLFSMTKENN